MKLVTHLIAATALALCANALAQDINFGVIATDSATVQRQRWEPLLEDMERNTGLRVHAFFAPDYNGVIEAMRFNKVQVAWMGNKAAMEAVDRASGEVFAQVVYTDGTMGYKSLIITNSNSKVKSLDDLLQHSHDYTFGNGDPNSTSGFLVPSYYVFARNKVDPKTAFKAVTHASHGANVAAVLNNQVDAATYNTEQMGRLEAISPEKAKQVRILWTSPLIPSDPFVWRTDLDPAIKAKVKDFFVGYGKTPEEKAVLDNIHNYGGFRASSNAQLVPIRQLEMFKERELVTGDATLSPAERQKKVAEIDARLAELGKSTN